MVHELSYLMFQDLTSLVVDIGTCKTKIGYGGDDAPKLAVCSSLARPIGMDRETNKYLIGDKQLNVDQEQREIESIFQKTGAEGYAYDFERTEAFLDHMFHQQLHINLPDYSILFSEDIAAKPHQSRKIREKLSQMVFERFGSANIYFLKSPVLGCFATGRSTATVLDSGQSFTRVVAVHDGFCLQKSSRCVPFGGRTFSQQIQASLQAYIKWPLEHRFAHSKRNYEPSFAEFHLQELLTQIKETISVRRSEESAETLPNSVQYQLPDRNSISLDRKNLKHDIFTKGEGSLLRTIPTMIGEIITSCDVDIKKELYSNILMIGGNVLYDGLMQDTIAKVTEFSPPNAKVKSVSVCSPSERKYMPWIGGSIVTSLSSFQNYWVGAQEWKEQGGAIIEKKCV